MKFQVLLIFLTSLSICANGQDNKSRLEWLDSFFTKQHNDNIEELLASLRKDVSSARDAHDKEKEALTRKELGLIQLTRIPHYDSALSNFIRAVEIEDSLQLHEEQTITYLAMARVFEDVGDFNKSLEMLHNATETSRELGDVNILVYILNNMGRVNTLLGRDDDAFENYELVLKNKNELSSRRAEADAYYNLGQLHFSKTNFEKALTCHKESLAIRRGMKDKAAEASSLNAIGTLYSAMKNTDKALANHQVALQIRSKSGDEYALAETYNNIGILYYGQGNIERAVANLQIALDKAHATQHADQQARSYEYLSLCYKAAGDYKKALEFEESYAKMIDFLRSEKIEHELVERQNRSVLEKKEIAIRNLEHQKRERELKIESQRKTQNFLTILVGFGIIILLLLCYLYLVKRRANIALEAAHAKVNRQNEELQNLNATKDKFFSIISHDLKGPLNSFTAFSGMLINHTDSLSKEEIQMLAKEIDKNLKNLFSLLENLLEWSRSQTGNIEFKPEVFNVSDLIMQNCDLLKTQAKNKGIELAAAATNHGTFMVNAHKHSINTVIRNLISNAIKFTPQGGRISISVERKDFRLTIKIADTGVGMSPDVVQKLFRIDTKYSTQGTANEKGTGLGLILCKEFIEKNGGAIGVQSEAGKGSTFYFTLSEYVAPAVAQNRQSIEV